MKLLIKFPTRGRKEQFFNVFEKYQQSITNPTTNFLISIDENDITMNNPEVLNKLKYYNNTNTVVGFSESKVHAVNRDINPSDDWDIVLLTSDDMVPQIVGFDDIIINHMKEYFPDTDGVLWYNDGFKYDKLNTLSILGKKYYERFGYIYYTEYKSAWCDNEFTQVSILLNKQKYFPMVIIKHEHPDYGYGKRDSIHHKNVIDFTHDLNIFNKRKQINFEL